MTVFQAPDGFETIVSSVLFKKVVAEGTSEVKILAGSTVKVHYTGKLFSDLSIFDSSVERGEPFSFKIGKGQVIKGWDEGVKTMKLGEKADLLMLPEYGTI
jgi:peptidylprolyl isomerase